MPISKKLTEKREKILRIARLIRSAQMKPGTVNDLNDLYGAGKGIWGSDAQEYVNRAREDRTRFLC